MIKNILLALFIVISGVLFFLWRSSSSSETANSKQVITASDPMNKNATQNAIKDATNTMVADEKETLKEVKNGDALDLSGKGLDKLPSNVLSMTNLESLDISYNNLEGALPGEIRRLQKLKVLKASDNKMTGVPAEVGQLSKLEILDLSNNQLTGLPNELGNLKNLKVLNLSGNNYSTQDLEKIKQGLPEEVQIIL